jgi:MarR family 2-MHQ and catechol resistance regulon transcriptional repressor
VEDTTGVHVWLILWKAFLAVGSHAERHIAALGLGRSDFGVLEVLLAKGPQPVNAIGPMVDLTPGSISVAVDRLVRKGFVRRRNDPADRRVRRVELTEKGRAVIAAGFCDHQKAMEAAATDLSTAERARLIRLLKKLGKGAAARL